MAANTFLPACLLHVLLLPSPAGLRLLADSATSLLLLLLLLLLLPLFVTCRTRSRTYGCEPPSEHQQDLLDPETLNRGQPALLIAFTFTPTSALPRTSLHVP
jgi:hypothetical protein